MESVIDIFRGDLVLGNGESLAIELELSADVLRIVTGGGSVGAWPVRYCRASPNGDGTFELSIDGEAATFTPVDPLGFATAAAERLVSSSLADRISTIKTLPVATEEATSDAPTPVEQPRLEKRRMLVGAGVTAVIISVVYVSFALPDKVEPMPADITADIPSVTSAPAVDWSELTVEQFAARWNATAIDMGISATLPSVQTGVGFDVAVSEWITIQGAVGDDGAMKSVVVSVDPSGPPESDLQALAVWGVLVGTVEPSATPAERREVLNKLGVDPDDPVLPRGEASADRGSNRYTIQYVELASLVLFQVRGL